MRFAAWCVLLAACVQAHEKKQPPEAAPEAEVPRSSAIDHVQHKLDLARGIEMLLIRGELAAARPLARAIADEPDDPDDPWRRTAVRLRNEAAGIAFANTLDESLVAIGQLAKECAECHAQSALPTAFPMPSRRAAVTPLERHRWAADRLWEGSISGHEDAWLSALDIFATTEIPRSDVVRLHDLQRVADSARGAWREETRGRRAELYSELLGVCASCHTELQRLYPR